MKLTDKQNKFCYEYCIDLNATQAAIRAGYSKKTAGFIGSENLKKPYIQKIISEMQAKLEEEARITALRILFEHKKIAFSTISNLYKNWIELSDFESLSEEEKACIKSISTKIFKQEVNGEIVDVEYVKVELYDKQKSLAAITQMLGYNSPAKQVINGSSEVEDPFAQKRKNNGITIRFVSHARDETEVSS